MTVQPDTGHPVNMTTALDQLVAREVPGRYAFFFVSGEDEVYPDGTEETSGYVIDEQGQIHAFWTGWDAASGAMILEQWEQVEEEPQWLQSIEYRRARSEALSGAS